MASSYEFLPLLFLLLCTERCRLPLHLQRVLCPLLPYRFSGLCLLTEHLALSLYLRHFTCIPWRPVYVGEGVCADATATGPTTLFPFCPLLSRL